MNSSSNLTSNLIARMRTPSSVLLSLLVFLSVFYLATLLIARPDPFVHSDSKNYWLAAKTLLQTGEYYDSLNLDLTLRSFRPPFTTYFMAGWQLWGVTPRGMLFVYWALASGTAFLLVGVVRRVGLPHPYALLAGVLYLLHPTVFFLSRSLMSETVFAFIIVLSLYVWLLALQQFSAHPWRALLLGFLAGLLFGVSVLTRNITTYLIPFVVLWPAYLQFRNAKPPVRPRLWFSALLAIFILGLALPVIPWQVRNQRVHHEFVFVNTAPGYNLYIGICFDGKLTDEFQAERLALYNSHTEAEATEIFRERANEFIRQHPGDVLLRTVKKAFLFWTFAYVQPLGAALQFVLFVLVIASCVFVLRGTARGDPVSFEMWPFLFWIAIAWGIHSLTFMTTRFTIQIVPPVSILVSYLAFTTKEQWRSRIVDPVTQKVLKRDHSQEK